MVNTPYRSEIARRLRRLYQRLWVDRTPPAVSEDEAEWLVRAVSELDAIASQDEAGELSSAEQLLVDLAVHGMPPVSLKELVQQSVPKLAAAIRLAESVRDLDERDPRLQHIRQLLQESSVLRTRGESGPAATRQVEAIKAYRELHDCTLSEARKACEAMMPATRSAA